MAEREYTRHQKKIINNYYRHRDTMALQKLQEFVTDLYLAESEKKKNALWKRIEKAIEHFDISDELREHILTSRDPEVLAANVTSWLSSPPPLKEKKKKDAADS